MALKRTVAPTALAVTLAEAKAACKVDSADEDALITALIHSATDLCEQAMGGRAVQPQTWVLSLDQFPEAFTLTRTPVASVTTLKYYDGTGTQQTLSGAAYVLDGADEDITAAYVVPAYDASWPSTRDQVNAVELTYVAGWANAAAVPYGVKAWILLMVAELYANREAGAVRSLGAADRLLDRHKIWGF